MPVTTGDTQPCTPQWMECKISLRPKSTEGEVT